MDRYELRKLDYGLSQEQSETQAALREFFTKYCPLETVDAAKGSGFDRSLWTRFCATGATAMALSVAGGGDDASMVDLTLVAEELGRAIAPLPWIDHVCTLRLLDRLGALGAVSDGAPGGERILGLDPALGPASGPRLIPAAAAADHVVVRQGDDIALLTCDPRPPVTENIGRLPMAWVDPDTIDARTVLASGPDAVAKYQRALDEWRLLTAAALVGVVDAAMMTAAKFATSRFTLGVPISTLQGISHPLANIAVVVHGARNLARRAAWFLDNEPEFQPELPAAAFVFIAEEATRATTVAAQAQGGMGVSTESASSSYLVRARGWALAGGDPAATSKYVAELVSARESRSRKG